MLGSEIISPPAHTAEFHNDSESNGTYLWIEVEMVVSSVFVCDSDFAPSKRAPLG